MIVHLINTSILPSTGVGMVLVFNENTSAV